jgi:RNA polymerase sigma-70 factor, ECF subfamily
MKEGVMSLEANGHGFDVARYRAYLHYLAGDRLRSCPRNGVGASDVVHEALLKAHVKREQFRGRTEAEWRAWLVKILANVSADASRKLPQGAILDDLQQSASRLENLLPVVHSTPSKKLEKQEQIVRLAEALVELPDDERTAVEMRPLQVPRATQAEIALRLNRPTAKAGSGLLERGLKRLGKLLGQES